MKIGQPQYLLAAIGPVLSQSDNEQAIAQGVTDIIVPDFADWCAIDILEPDLNARIVAQSHSPEVPAQLFSQTMTGTRLEYSYRDGATPPVYQGKSEFYAQLTDETFRSFHPSRQRQLAGLRTRGLHALLYVPLILRGQVAGAMTLALLASARQFDAQDLHTAEEVARRIALEFDNVRLLRGERESRQAIESVAERIARLQQVTAALSQAVTPNEVIQIIVDESLRAFDAQAAALNLLVTTASHEPQMHIAYSRGYSQELLGEYRDDSLTTPAPAAVAFRTGQALWYSSRQEILQQFPNLLDLHMESFEYSMAVLPLRTDRGVLGVLVLSFAHHQRFDGADRDFLLTLANQSAQAVERSRLYAAEQTARQIAEESGNRTRVLQALTAALSNALTPVQVAATVVDQGTQVLDARAGFVAIFADDHYHLDVIAQRGYSADAARLFRRFGMNAPVPIVAAIRRRTACWYESRADLEAQFGALPGWMLDNDNAWVDIPLIVEDRALGAIGLSFVAPRRFTDDDKAFINALAQQCAQSLQRAQLFQAERAARSVADHAARRSAFMAESSQTLATSMDFETRLSQMAALAVPELADWCVVSVMNDDDTIRLAVVTHVDPNNAGALRMWTSQTHLLPSTDGNLMKALAMGGTAFTSKLTDEHYRLFAQNDAQMLHYWRESRPHSMITVALTAHGHTFGAVHFGVGLNGRKYIDAERAMITEWVNRMALSVDNARLYQELKSANAALELRVAQRTEALKNSRDQLRNLTGRLQAAREEERARVSREVHDVIGQILTGLKMDISALGRKLQQENSPSVSRIKDMNGLLDEAIKSVRKVATELRPAILDNFGLVAAVEWQLREFETRFGIACDFTCSAEQVALQEDRATAVFRLIQEALTNIARHAEATEVAVSLIEQDNELLIEISDNGRGITEQELSATRSLGLVGMRERVNLLEGTINFEGHPNHGTTVTVKLPLTA